jgi:gluconolactonase
MKNLLPAVMLSSFFASCGTNTNPTGNEKKDTVVKEAAGTRIEILDAEGAGIIDSTAKVENLAGGFSWTEGPLYIADGDYLLFSDIPANKVMKWKEGEGISTFLYPSGYTGPEPAPKKEPGSNGLLLDKNGRLVLCQHGDRRIARMKTPLNNPTPQYETVADRYMGKRFNSPNDAVYHPNGDLYLTDPPYGLDGGNDDSAKELDFHGVFRVTPDGKVDLVTSEYKFPNGIAVTPDGKYLLVGHSDPDNKVWMKYELNGNGLIANKSVFYKVSDTEKSEGGPDGMKMSKKGYLFASGPGGIWIFNQAGKPIARIYTGQATSNCALTDNEKTLFMTCDDFLYRVKLK